MRIHKKSLSNVFVEAEKMSRVDFLEYFKGCGCFFDDLSLAPINKLSNEERGNVINKEYQCLRKGLRDAIPML